MEICVCLGMIGLLLFLYWCCGKLFFLAIGGTAGRGLTLLCGVFVYHALFQLLALPLIFLHKPLSWLSVGWIAALAVMLAALVILWKRGRARIRENGGRIPVLKCLPLSEGTPLLTALMLLAAAVQMYYMIANNYLGWDTLFYVGTIGTTVSTDAMYLNNGESGWIRQTVDMRYALSSFYMHAAVWCQLLKLTAISYAKIVQGGMLAVLENLTVFELGRFLFSRKRYRERLSKRQRADCAAGMVIAAVVLNFFYQSIYTTSDFLLNRALEAKGYCADLILPFLFLLGLMMWRDAKKKETRAMLLAAMFGSVAISMSALLTAPALVTFLLAPVLVRERTWKTLRLYLLCMLPNAAYFAVYMLYK